MLLLRALIFFCIFWGYSYPSLAIKAKIEKVQSFKNLQRQFFVKNAGQLPDSILYYIELSNGTTIYFMRNGYQVSTREIRSTREHHILNQDSLQEEAKPLRGHNYFVYFVKHNIDVKLEAQKPISTKIHFLQGQYDALHPEGIHASMAQAIQYTGLYRGIDLRFFVQDGALKFNIIVQPGANLEDYKTVYYGINDLQVKSQKIIITTSLTKTEELIPESYQLDENGEKLIIDIRYKQDPKTKQVYLKAKNADPNQTLVVDPLLVFATFSGSSVDNWGFSATYSRDGSMYLAGIVFRFGYSGTPGAFKVQYSGGRSKSYKAPSGTSPDIIISKFSPDGSKLIYCTYIGGSGDDLPHSLIENGSNELIILGRTNSTNFHKNNLHLMGPRGGIGEEDSDILLCRLSEDGGSLLNSWIIGGSSLDGANIRGRYGRPAASLYNFYGDDARGEVNIDNEGFIYVGSQTQSADFPVTPNASQKNIGGGQDGVILKFDSKMDNLLYSSFIGGNFNDAVFVLSISPKDNNIYVAGSTQSDNFPGVQNGSSLKGRNNGDIDGFISIINGRDMRIERSTYVGTDLLDGVYGLRIDKKGYVYVTGITFGNWPTINAQYSDKGGKQFIGKIDPSLSKWIYTTKFGTNVTEPNISPIAFAIDRCEHVYVSGFGFMGSHLRSTGTDNMKVTPDAIKSTTDNRDFYFAVFDKDAKSLLYATFYGKTYGLGDHVDGGTSRYDPSGVVYQAVCADCDFPSNIPYPTTAGVYAPVKGTNGSDCNMLGIKFDFQLSGVTVKGISSIYGIRNRNLGCVEATFDLEDIDLVANGYKWDFDDGTQITAESKEPKIRHTFTKVGTYRTKLIGIDLNTCNQTDTSEIKIIVANNKILPSFTIGAKKDCKTLLYTFFNTSTLDPSNTDVTDIDQVDFRWDFGDGTSQTSHGLEPVDHIFPAQGPYVIKLSVISKHICNYNLPVEKIVRVSNDITTKFNVDNGKLCVGKPVKFKNNSTAGENFIWRIDGTDVVYEENLVYTFTKPGEHEIYLHGFDRNTCNLEDDTTIKIFISEPSIANFNFEYSNSKLKEFPRFINNSQRAKHYIWDFGDGSDLLYTDNKDTIIHHYYDKTGNYTVCLTAYNDISCTDKKCNSLEAKVNPYFKAPTAFSPNGDGINDVFLPLVIGVRTYELNIYNRWGQNVFHTTDTKAGWNGTMNGKGGEVLASDMYFYTYVLETTDGKFIKNNGIIYLLVK